MVWKKSKLKPSASPRKRESLKKFLKYGCSNDVVVLLAPVNVLAFSLQPFAIKGIISSWGTQSMPKQKYFRFLKFGPYFIKINTIYDA